jgi:hypothetical protein
MKRETDMEIKYFIKREKRKVKKVSKTALLPQKFRGKLQNTGHANQEINRNSTPQISTEKQRFNFKKYQY